MAIMRLLVLPITLVGLPMFAQVFNCGTGGTAFNSTAFATCSVTWPGPPNNDYAFFASSNLSGSVVSGAIDFIPSGSGHSGNGLFYQTPVNVQGFTTNFTWVGNGYNLSFVINNAGGTPPNNGSATFSSGAGGEGGFYQAFTTASPPGPGLVLDMFALQFDSYYPLTVAGGSFAYSSAQLYQGMQCPYVPGSNTASNQIPCYQINKISTSPVALNSPSTTPGSPSSDTFSATISYSGNTLSLCLYDVTAANGSCSSATSGTGTYFQQTWTGVYIPGIVGASTGYVGFTNGTAATTSQTLTIKSFEYTVNSASSGSGFTAYNAGSTTNNGTVSAASPIYSVAPGSYSGTQSVSLSTSTSQAYICYTLSSSYPAVTPNPDGNGGCPGSTLYSGPISISSSTTLYAMAGSNNGLFALGSTPANLVPPSTLVAGTYTITGGGTASTPIFSPVAGAYTGTQSVTLSTSSGGAVICYTTNATTPATNGSTGCTTGTLYSSPVSVSTSETIKAIAGGTGYTDSSIGSAAYTIQASTPTFSPVAGTYVGTQNVTLSTTSSGAIMCYTINGSTPATNGSTGCTTGTPYSSAITVASSETIKAIAGGTGYSDSSVGSAAYAISSSSTTITGNTTIGGKVVIQ
jgi:Chitobiase/beta-hexosaminidase C-terminal domain